MNKEYIDFKFGDKWASEFNLVTVSTGDRYSPPVFGSIQSNTSSVAGKRGVYKWRTQLGEKQFSISIAYDNLSIRDVSKIKTWLCPTKVKKLIFSDEPYKFYYACLSSDPKFEYLPFIEESGKMVGTKQVYDGCYRGELTLDFIAIDGVSYSEYKNYETVEIENNLEYRNSGYVNSIMPWVQSSNLLNNDRYEEAARIYSSSFFDQDTGESENNGLGPDFAHRFYLLNSGDSKTPLSLSFDFVLPGEQPLVIYTQKVQKLDGDGWETIELISATVIESFKEYVPFIEYIGQENYDILISTATDVETIKKKKEIMNKYIIEIDSELREIYIKEKANLNNVLNINKFNGNRDFLRLCESNFIDYAKPFPTLVSESGAIEPTKIVYKGTAIEDTYFNEVFLGATDTPYRLVNVHFNWKHTYN